jgi:hypothetical protein
LEFDEFDEYGSEGELEELQTPDDTMRKILFEKLKHARSIHYSQAASY